jgi:urease accessory protein
MILAPFDVSRSLLFLRHLESTMHPRTSFGRPRAAHVVTALLLGGAAFAAQAHTGHGAHGLEAGLTHPFGADHLLAMFAVGLWSVFALPASRAWTGPATFLAALAGSAALGASGVTVPFLEHAIAVSVVLFGLMLAFAVRGVPVAAGLITVALAASLHGLAHGAEAPVAGSFAAVATYAIGFLAATAALHLGGVATGLALRRWFSAQAPRIVGGLGLLCGAAGLVLLTQA